MVLFIHYPLVLSRWLYIGRHHVLSDWFRDRAKGAVTLQRMIERMSSV